MRYPCDLFTGSSLNSPRTVRDLTATWPRTVRDLSGVTCQYAPV